jgi:hypothetical protein
MERKATGANARFCSSMGIRLSDRTAVVWMANYAVLEALIRVLKLSEK